MRTLLRATLGVGLLLLALIPGAAGAATSYDLPAEVAAALAREALPPGSLSLYVHRTDAEAPTLAVRADQPRNPASTMKLVTTLAGLKLLGPAYTWTTGVYASRPPVQGVLDGDLYIQGSGDPFLVYERFWRLLRAVRARGIARITGDLVLDTTRFEPGAFDPGAFDGKPTRAYNAGASALLINFHALTLTLQRPLHGRAVSLTVEPTLAGLKLVNDVKLTKGACRGRLRVRLAVGPSARRSELPELRLTGRFPYQCKRYSFVRSVGHHQGYALGLFRQLWAELGGVLEGGVRSGSVPADALLVARTESPPLGDLIRGINKHSNNVMARNLLLTLGAEAFGEPGNLAKGRAAVLEWLAAEGHALPAFVIDNGAGLSRDARTTARHLGQLLLSAHRDPLMSEFVSSLALAGLDGSMRKRFNGGPLEGAAHLKTGLLNNVRAVAGYLHASDGRDHVVVALQSHPGVHTGSGTRVQNALLRWLHNGVGPQQPLDFAAQ